MQRRGEARPRPRKIYHWGSNVQTFNNWQQNGIIIISILRTSNSNALQNSQCIRDWLLQYLYMLQVFVTFANISWVNTLSRWGQGLETEMSRGIRVRRQSWDIQKNCFEAALNLASRTTSLSMPQHACGLQQCDILPTACTLMMTHWWWQYDTVMVNNFTKINVYWPVYWASSGCSYCHVLHEPMSQVMVVCGHSQTSSEGETCRPETPTSPLNCILDFL